MTGTDPHRDLVRLGRLVAASDARLAIAGEGNISCRTGDNLVVTASGARLGALSPSQLVEVTTAPLLAAIDSELEDPAWLDVILGSRLDAEAARPTVEVALHAVISDRLHARWILHAHPTDVLAIACSDRLPEFALTRLFPDHVVALGSSDLWLPYIDPGRPLAVAVRDALVDRAERDEDSPRAIILGNHGAFVVGATAMEAFDRMAMLAKAARIFLEGGTIGLPAAAVARIAGREDESYRQMMLERGTSLGALIDDEVGAA